MNNNLTFQFGMYEPATDSIIVNTGENSILVIRCKECNSSVISNDPSDVVYLYHWQRKHLFYMRSLHWKQMVCRTMWMP